MNVKLLLALFLFVFQFSFSQTEKLLKGVVSSENFLLQDVEVINKTSEKSTKTSNKGEFLIEAKANDSLLFYSKKFHLKRVKISKEHLELNDLQVLMIMKPEELEEVVVETVRGISLKGDKAYEKEKRSDIDVVNSVEYIKKRTVYEGTIDNGSDFMGIAIKLVRLFLKEKESKRTTAIEIDFATLAKSTCNLKFFTENLKLKPDEIELFLQYCDSDPKSKRVKENTNILSMMGFLAIKNSEFQKLK
ncbi:MAG: hypothetical protein ABI554_13600 [Flavobacterium sp.]